MGSTSQAEARWSHRDQIPTGLCRHRASHGQSGHHPRRAAMTNGNHTPSHWLMSRLPPLLADSSHRATCLSAVAMACSSRCDSATDATTVSSCAHHRNARAGTVLGHLGPPFGGVEANPSVRSLWILEPLNDPLSDEPQVPSRPTRVSAPQNIVQTSRARRRRAMRATGIASAVSPGMAEPSGSEDRNSTIRSAPDSSTLVSTSTSASAEGTSL